MQRKMHVMLAAAATLTVGSFAIAQPLPADNFSGTSLNTNLWTVDSGTVTVSNNEAMVGGGNASAEMSSTNTALYEDLTFQVNGLYDSRSALDYSQYSVGYAGYYNGSDWILVRNDDTGGAGLEFEVHTDGQTENLGGLSIADHQLHDVVFNILWSPTAVTVQMDDLNDGVGVDFSNTETNLIPSAPMGFDVNAEGAPDSSYDSWNVANFNSVPEPTSLGLISLAAMAMSRRIRRPA